jgi:endonuclease/exonuclease/phosphatase (EEP) superfamily protein YafD
MNRPLLQTALFVLLAFSACVNIPREHRMVSQRGDIREFRDARDCGTVELEKILDSDQEYKTGLDSGGFKILNWNVFKGWKEGWKEDFSHLSAGNDILTIQEARLTDDLNGLLQKGRYNWDISTAFTYNGADVGVLTASRLEPLFACTFRIKEPLTSIPKTALITLYPLTDTDKYLMVINIHSINLAVGLESYSIQLEKVEEILFRHEGPMIFSGDFNSWSTERMVILKDLSMRLGLKAVTFQKQNRTTVFGRDIDHIYYRGLSVREAAVIKVTSSDHNPMLVTFKLEEAR